MAIGEKRLLSLINATVSHELRNPMNSIHVQVTEMNILNQRLESLVNDLSFTTLESTKMKFEELFLKYKQSVKIQMSSEELMSFLVNNILDYAQISSGKFRKQYNVFNVKNCIEEVILVLQFKAQ